MVDWAEAIVVGVVVAIVVDWVLPSAQAVETAWAIAAYRRVPVSVPEITPSVVEDIAVEKLAPAALGEVLAWEEEAIVEAVAAATVEEGDIVEAAAVASVEAVEVAVEVGEVVAVAHPDEYAQREPWPS